MRRRSSSFLRPICLILALVATGVAWADPRTGHRYDLVAVLDPETHTVRGTGRIEWVNQSTTPVTHLLFHLYLNAFENDQTVFMRESGGRLRGDAFQGEGHIEVQELRLADGRDLLQSADSELIPGDRTQMSVPLPEPVPPGGHISLVTRFRSVLPPVFARSGHQGSFHVVAQWFPKLARLEPDGHWASFPYHGFGEFYADFARYELTVDTPRGFVVGATGTRLAEERANGRVRRRFLAEPIHDAAFVAWPHFREYVEPMGAVRVRLLVPPGHALAARRHFTVIRAGLRHFGKAYGPYPYPTLTVVVPPRDASGAAGMEYPTLFASAGPWFVLHGARLGLQDTTTAHELAHQWFQGLIATNEVRWPMLDEGLATWATYDLLGAMYGRDRSLLDLPGIRVSAFRGVRSFVMAHEPGIPGRAAPEFRTAGAYGRAVYGQTALALETVAQGFGRKKLERALGLYARRHRFGHPSPEDLFAAFDDVLGRGFSTRFLRPALMDGKQCDAHIDELVPGRLRISRALDVPTTVRIEARDGSERSIPFEGTELDVPLADDASLVRVMPLPLERRLRDNVGRLPGSDGPASLFAKALPFFQLLLSPFGP